MFSKKCTLLPKSERKIAKQSYKARKDLWHMFHVKPPIKVGLMKGFLKLIMRSDAAIKREGLVYLRGPMNISKELYIVLSNDPKVGSRENFTRLQKGKNGGNRNVYL